VRPTWRTWRGGELGGKLFALGFSVGEADPDEAVVGQRLVQRGNDGVVHASAVDVKSGIKFLRARALSSRMVCSFLQ